MKVHHEYSHKTTLRQQYSKFLFIVLKNRSYINKKQNKTKVDGKGLSFPTDWGEYALFPPLGRTLDYLTNRI